MTSLTISNSLCPLTL
jgi:hypothetical protein